MLENEAERLKAVKAFRSYDLSKFTEFNTIVNLAAEICGTPIALLTLLDDQTNHFIAKVGVDIPGAPRSVSFCQYAIQQDDLMIVPDTLKDERFVDFAPVVNAPHVRFYAGSPLATADGHKLGTLCVVDVVPHELTDVGRSTLKKLTEQAARVLELHVQQSLLTEQVEKVQQHADLLKGVEDVESEEAKGSVATMDAIMGIIKKEGYTSAYKYLPIMQDAIKKIDEQISTEVQQAKSLSEGGA